MIHDTGSHIKRWRYISAARRRIPKLQMSNCAPLKWQSAVIGEDPDCAGGAKSLSGGRKRIWLSLVLCLGAGVLISWGGGLVGASNPESPLEFHKEKYLSARAGDEDVARPQRGVDRLRFHQAALLKLGYLQQKAFVISNRPASKVQLSLVGMPGENLQLTTIETPGMNRLVITAVKEDMPLWEDLVRDADVKERSSAAL